MPKLDLVNLLQREMSLKKYYEVPLDLEHKTLFEFEMLERMAMEAEESKDRAQREKDMNQLRLGKKEFSADKPIILKPDEPPRKEDGDVDLVAMGLIPTFDIDLTG